MRQLNRLGKTIIYTTIGAGTLYGGYYLYSQNNQNNIENPQPASIISTTIITPIFEPEKTIESNIVQNVQMVAQVENQKIINLKANNEEAILKTVEQNKKPEQQSVSENGKKSFQQSISNIQPKQPQPVNHQKSKEKQVIATQQIQQNQKQKKQEFDFSIVKKLSQIPQFPLQNSFKIPQKTIIVADLGFTQQFQDKMIQIVHTIKKLPNSQKIQVYKKNILKPQISSVLKQKYGAQIKQQTLFLMKNQLQDNFVSVQFDMFMQYPSIMTTYMTDLHLYNIQNQEQYMKRIQKMGPNQSYLLYVYDDSEPADKKAKRILAAKYLQMQLALHHMQNSVKVVPVEASVLKEHKMVPTQSIRANSLHIIRKHNEFTYASPNLFLNFHNSLSPYYLLNDIGFHTKKGQVSIPKYLSKIQTFDALSINTPYLISINIDRNRISTQNYQSIMNTFKYLKRSNKFPQVSFAVKYGEVGYTGKNYPQNKQFSIKVANVAELDNQSYLHEIQTTQELNHVTISQDEWLTKSHQYLYPHQVINQKLISSFVEKVLKNDFPMYYRSDRPSTIYNVHKIVGSTFQKQIIQNQLDHLVFEYSDNCPSCKMISPLIGYLNQVLDPTPIEQRFDIHRINCNQNRVKGQVYSPYTPNINYYKNEWKKEGPVRLTLQQLNHRGMLGLYDFCIITKILKTIDMNKFQQSVQNAKQWNKAQFLL